MNFLDKEFSKITENISLDRLSSYKFNGGENIEIILKRYIYNVQISESFYPLLSAFEIALRNRIYNAICNLKGETWLLDEINTKSILSDNERNILIAAYNKLETRYKKSPKSGSIIAGLTLGFWINLCKKSYKNSLWDKEGFFNSVFPDFNEFFVSPVLDKTKTIFPLLKEILILRNRIFHHEIIINNKNGIENCYDTTYKVLCSLSKEYVKLFETSLRFKELTKQKPW